MLAGVAEERENWEEGVAAEREAVEWDEEMLREEEEDCAFVGVPKPSFRLMFVRGDIRPGPRKHQNNDTSKTTKNKKKNNKKQK